MAPGKRKHRREVVLRFGLFSIANRAGGNLWEIPATCVQEELAGEHVVGCGGWSRGTVNTRLVFESFASHGDLFFVRA